MLRLLSSKICFEFATKMQASSTQKTKDSAGKRLGVKKFGGEEVFPNDILIRQRGFRWKPGQNTVYGRDHTIHSKAEGVVFFRRDPHKYKKTYFVDIIKTENPNRTVRPPPPYCYHPELFPELAKNNPPEFIPYLKPKPQQPIKEKQLNYSIVGFCKPIDLQSLNDG
ncbi:hypothetical protein pb186bvf_015173 [Paramecium bursaria]